MNKLGTNFILKDKHVFYDFRKWVLNNFHDCRHYLSFSLHWFTGREVRNNAEVFGIIKSIERV